MRQGDPAAGLLFIAITAVQYTDAEQAMDEHQDEQAKKQWTHLQIKHEEMRYADDAVLIGLATKCAGPLLCSAGADTAHRWRRKQTEDHIANFEGR